MGIEFWPKNPFVKKPPQKKENRRRWRFLWSLIIIIRKESFKKKKLTVQRNVNGTVIVANFWPWSSRLEPPSTAVVLSPNGHPNDSAPPGNSLRHSRNAVVHFGQSTVFDFSFSLLPQQYPSIRWFLSFEISRILSSKEPAPFIFQNQRWNKEKKREKI
jgi:hypothetical protein